MALIKCNECGQMISDRATKCPKCGCPIERVEAYVIGADGREMQKISSDPSYKPTDRGIETKEGNKNEDLSWINGNWRYQIESLGDILEMRVGISGESIV